MTRQGGALPKSRPPRVSALGVRVARFRHWCRDNWADIELAAGVLLVGSAMALLVYGALLAVILLAPVSR